MNSYGVELEISGQTAMFTRPDTGSSPVSYPVPTFSAVKGIFEAILMLRQAVVIPTKVEICAPVNFHSYTTNYLGPARKKGQKGALQIPATVLTDVCYRLYAQAHHHESPWPRSKYSKQDVAQCSNGGHAYQSMFNRRMSRGQCFRTPCLGWKEFPANYFGPFRDTSTVQKNVNLFIPTLFKTYFQDGPHSAATSKPIFMNNVEVRGGVLHYV